MTMNLRADETFVQDKGWYQAGERYSDFIRRHKGLHVLFLELGVGMNTPIIIKYPFWQMTAANSVQKQADNFGGFFVNQPKILVVGGFYITIGGFGCDWLATHAFGLNARFYFLADVLCVPF